VQMIDRIRGVAESVLPKQTTAVVISRGDEELLSLGGRVAWHYPQFHDGRYAGHYPVDSAEAVRQLETLRSRGGRFLIVPGTAFWWLEHYEGLRHHLDDHAKRLWTDGDCTIYQLQALPAEPVASPEPATQLESAAVAAADPVAAVLACSPLDRYDAWLEVNRWNERREADLR